MAQAKRNRKARANPKKGSGSRLKPSAIAFRQGLGFFLTGAMTGVLAVLFWQGYNSAEQGDMGSGLKAMIDQSRVQARQREAEIVPPEPVLVDKAPRIKPQYDFYTVLPEIEEVLPKDAAELPPPKTPPAASPRPATTADRSENPKPPRAAPSKPLPPGSAYMLQVASYGQRADAERLKAKLALGGMRASIQKVSIDSKDYFRVRIGPYSDYGTMTSDDYKLSNMGFKAMRLRVSKAG